MYMHTELHKITEDEWEKFRDMRLRAVAESLAAFGDTFEQVAAKPESYWRKKIRSGYVYAIEENDRYIAGVVFNQDDDDGVWMIQALWVDPLRRGMGFGAALVQRVIDTAKETGISAVELGINPLQTEAVDLYKRFGFKGVRHIENISWGDGSVGNLTVMHLDLRE